MRLLIVSILFSCSVFGNKFEKRNDIEYGNSIRKSSQFVNFLRSQWGDITNPNKSPCMDVNDFSVESRTLLSDSQGNHLGTSEYLVVMSNQKCLAPYTFEVVSFITIARYTWETDKESKIEVLTGGLNAEKDRIINFGTPDKDFKSDAE